MVVATADRGLGTDLALAAYMGKVRQTSGRLSDVLQAHMELYWAWIDSGLAIEDAHRNAARAARAFRPGHRLPPV